MIIGVTTGDSCGIGPEVLLKAFSLCEIRHPLVVYGDIGILDYYNDILGYRVPLTPVAEPLQYRAGSLNVIDAGILRRGQLTVGKINEESGRAAREYVLSAARDALAGRIDAMVTLPLSKEATRLSDPGFTGHTELIGDLCGVKDVTIMLASEHLIVTHVSTHVSLTEAINLVRKDRICTIIRLTWEALRKLKPEPRIAVAGLNPHAGENGLFGDQEGREIRPAVEWAQSQGMPLEGPFPPDTVFYLSVRQKRFDAVVCMYHDQGHIPIKLLDFEGGVNITLGLPIVRTSVDHGTAFDIAGRGIASTRSFVRALDYAALLSTLNKQSDPVGPVYNRPAPL
jgi:4-hydroxythreonine-4-phosphate dehydrogenase